MSTLSQRFEGEEEERQAMPLLHIEEERMHARLEQYLVEAEAGLKSLTPAEQRAELLELRSHLAALMEAEQELGATPEEAAINTLKQFGSAREVTDKIVEVRQTPGQQFRRALIVSVLGAALSYTAGQILSWTQSLEVPGGGTARTTFGLANFLPVLTPLFLGTLVGKLFPRAHRARVPIVAAACTWIVTSIWSMLGAPFDWAWLDSSFHAGSWQVWLQVLSNPAIIVSYVNTLVVFLTLAWAAQSVARRPARAGGWIAWGKDLLSRIPDTWVGAIAVYSLASTGFALLRLPLTLWELTAGVQKNVFNFSPEKTALSLATTLVIGAVVGRVLPKRGWCGPLIQSGATLIGGLSLLLAHGESIQGAKNAGWYSLLYAAAALVATVIAYFVGRRRQMGQIR